MGFKINLGCDGTDDLQTARPFRDVGGVMALSVCPLALRAFGDKPVIRRVIPSSGHALAVVGLGSWQTVSPLLRSTAIDVMRRFVDLGSEVVDTSPMYGSAERRRLPTLLSPNLNDQDGRLIICQNSLIDLEQILTGLCMAH